MDYIIRIITIIINYVIVNDSTNVDVGKEGKDL